ncbi:MAG: heme ABC exporter ATP-binding protein CcmA [Hyphomicrobiaceae bacterium]
MRLIAENLTVERGSRTIFSRVSFQADAGEAVVLVGPNGAGKTTLLRTIAGFLRPAAGAIHLEGGGDELSVGEQAHFIGHANAIKAHLTVRENVVFWAKYLGGAEDAEARVDVALEHFSISALAEFPAAYLSAGQKRRVGLARLLVAARPLWLLDEPTVSLDAASTKVLGAAVNAHLANGGLVIAATHLPLGFARAREFDVAAASGSVLA